MFCKLFKNTPSGQKDVVAIMFSTKIAQMHEFNFVNCVSKNLCNYTHNFYLR